MGVSIYGNVSGVSRKAKGLDGNVNGVNRKFKEAYAKVNGVVRKVYSGYQCKAYTGFIGGSDVSNINIAINSDGSGHFSATKSADESLDGTFRFFFVFSQPQKGYKDDELFHLLSPTVSNTESRCRGTIIYDITSEADNSKQYCMGSSKSFIDDRVLIGSVGDGRSAKKIRVDITIEFSYSRQYVASYSCSWPSGALRLFGKPMTSVELI